MQAVFSGFDGDCFIVKINITPAESKEFTSSHPCIESHPHKVTDLEFRFFVENPQEFLYLILSQIFGFLIFHHRHVNFETQSATVILLGGKVGKSPQKFQHMTHSGGFQPSIL